jgi:hypothetical protein
MLLPLKMKIHASFLHIMLTEELLDTMDKARKTIMFDPYRAYNENGLIKLHKQTTARINEEFLSIKYVCVYV